jgi:hypothetical protein
VLKATIRFSVVINNERVSGFPYQPAFEATTVSKRLGISPMPDLKHPVCDAEMNWTGI